VTILAAKSIRKPYGGREVVAGIDLELARGECYGLLGPNAVGSVLQLFFALATSWASSAPLL
jgi:ABC-type lipopolysaccharide export system ATPase subunit